jgi:hypothetical protein
MLITCIFAFCVALKPRVTFPCTSLRDSFFITEVESVYCAVRTESLYYNTDMSRPLRVKCIEFYFCSFFFDTTSLL